MPLTSRVLVKILQKIYLVTDSLATAAINSGGGN
jgi:hypothetical protein